MPGETSPLVGGAFLIEKSDDVFTPEDFSEEHRQAMATADRFVTEEVLPVEARYEEKEDGLARKLLEKCGELGLLSILTPERYGGLELDLTSQLVVAEAYQRARGRGLRADQVALAAVDPRTHFVKAMVGSVDYNVSQYNRAVQARRQPGSSFKPFVYYTAFASGGYAPETTIDDSPVRYRDGSKYYEPQNYGGGYSGPVSIRAALASSLNVPAVKLGQEIGLQSVIKVSRDLGITSPLRPVVSLPLGSIDVSPLEMAGAYATFANGGWHNDVTAVLRVTDSQGNVLVDNQPQPKLLLDPWAVASLNSVLQDVVNGGTAPQAQMPNRPVAGKTGTTESERDVWFVGYVPQLSAAVWIGNDDFSPLGQGITGGGYAAPIWREFMEFALQGVPPQPFVPPSEFERPKPPKQQ